MIKPIIDTDAGINATIHISCSDPSELDGHLLELRKKFRAAFQSNPDFAEQRFDESNCAGTHDAVIVQEV